MKLTPLLLSILLLVSSKLKPLEPGFKKTTSFLINFYQPVYTLKNKFNQQKLFISSLPSMHFSNLTLQAENNQLKTQNLLLKNKLDLTDFKTPSWSAVPIRIIKVDSLITATSDQVDQIKPGMPLIQSTNLIGIVQKTAFSIVYILPLTNANVFFPVQTGQNIKGDYAVRDKVPQMTNLSNSASLNSNDTIFTLPTEQIPEGLIVGKIAQTLTQPSNPIQRIEIKLAINPSEASAKKDTHIILQP